MARTVYSAEHEFFRDMLRRFLDEHVAPFHLEWEKAGIVPQDVWLEAGRRGLLCPTVPEEYGGAGGDFGFCAVVTEEIARQNVTGLGFSMHSDVVAPYIVRYGSETLKQEWLPQMTRGEAIGALGMTEPGTGSDVKAIRTTARREGDEYVINGAKACGQLGDSLFRADRIQDWRRERHLGSTRIKRRAVGAGPSVSSW